MEFGGTRTLAAGVALFGAAAVAVASVPMLETTPTAISSMALPRVENARIDLMTSTADLYTLGGTGLVFEAANRLAGSVLDAPLAAIIVGLDLVNGDNASAYEQLKQLVDARQYIADPLIVGLSQGLPSELGGGSPTAGWNVDPSGQSGIVAFRDNVMVSQWRDGAEALLARVLGVPSATSIPDFNAAGSLVSLVENEPGTLKGDLSAGLSHLNAGLSNAFATGDVGGIGTGIQELVDAPLVAVQVVLTTLANAVPAATTAPVFNAMAANVAFLQMALDTGIGAAFPSSVGATTSTAAVVGAAKSVASTASAATAAWATSSTVSAAKATLAADKTALSTAKSTLSAEKTALSTAKSQLQADKTAGASTQTLRADKHAVSTAKSEVKAAKSTEKAGKSAAKAAKAAKGK